MRDRVVKSLHKSSAALLRSGWRPLRDVPAEPTAANVVVYERVPDGRFIVSLETGTISRDRNGVLVSWGVGGWPMCWLPAGVQ